MLIGLSNQNSEVWGLFDLLNVFETEVNWPSIGGLWRVDPVVEYGSKQYCVGVIQQVSSWFVEDLGQTKHILFGVIYKAEQQGW